MTGDVLITGATGLIGGEVAWRLMQRGQRVWCVVRGRGFAEAADRMRRRLAMSGQECDWNRLVALPGDVTQHRLGLSADTVRHLRQVCGHVIHCAADTSFSPRNRCAEVNLTGTRNVLDLCRLPGPQVRLFHTSSAVVCQESAAGIVREDDAPAGFSNDYVLSKRNCEALVLGAGVDAVVLRPSIVLSQGVNSPQFARSILWVLPVMRRLGVVPLTGDEPIDAVSVGFVAECVIRLLHRPLRHRVYHLSADREASTTLREVVHALTRKGHDYSGLEFAPAEPGSAAAVRGAIGEKLRGCLDYYLPFLRAGVVYDRTRVQAELGGGLPLCPKLAEYCAELLDLFTERDACAEADNP